MILNQDPLGLGSAENAQILRLIQPRMNLLWNGKWKPGTIEALRIILDHELVIFAKGSGTVEIYTYTSGHGDSAQTPWVKNMEAGSWCIVPAGCRHRSWAGDDGAYRHCLHFDWLESERNSETPLIYFEPDSDIANIANPAPPFIPQHILHGILEHDSPVYALLESLSLRWHSDFHFQRILAQVTLYEILCHLLAGSELVQQRRERHQDLAHMVKQALDELPAQTESVQDYLESLGYSYAHLARVFKKAFGVSPVYYLNAVRIEEAKRQLRRPRVSVVEAAEAAGFSDPAYFSRLFKKHVGCAPRDYRGDK